MASRRPASRLLIILALVVLASTSLQAQTVTGTMQGKVTDTSGAVLPGVTVTIRNMETGLERVAVTNGEGFFSAPFLPVGRYRVVAEMAGLGTMRREGVPVNLNQTTVQDFAIDPSISETITVNAEVPRVNVTDGEIKQTMQSEEIMALPAGNQTSFLHLAQNFSGFQENMTSGQDNPTASSGSSKCGCRPGAAARWRRIFAWSPGRPSRSCVALCLPRATRLESRRLRRPLLCCGCRCGRWRFTG